VEDSSDEEPSGTVSVTSDTDSVVENIVAAPVVVRKRSQTRRRKIRVIRRFKRGKVTRKLSERFLKKGMGYRAPRQRQAEIADM